MLDAPEVMIHALRVRQPPQTLHPFPKQDDDNGDKSWAQDFQDPKNIVNIIFGRDGAFPSKCGKTA
jgi:hypothetical protein